jgi:hypothetical protein
MLSRLGRCIDAQIGQSRPRGDARLCRPTFLPLRGEDLEEAPMADVLSFFQGAAFDDDATQVMGKAFDRACQSLHDNGQPI